MSRWMLWRARHHLWCALQSILFARSVLCSSATQVIADYLKPCALPSPDVSACYHTIDEFIQGNLCLSSSCGCITIGALHAHRIALMTLNLTKPDPQSNVHGTVDHLWLTVESKAYLKPSSFPYPSCSTL